MNIKMETINYTTFLEPYVNGDPDGPGEAQFAYWCNENGHQFDEWIMNVIDSVIYKSGMYKAQNLEEFEQIAEELYHRYS